MSRTQRVIRISQSQRGCNIVLIDHECPIMQYCCLHISRTQWGVQTSPTQWVIQTSRTQRVILISRTQWVILASRTQWVVPTSPTQRAMHRAPTQWDIHRSRTHETSCESFRCHELNESFTYHEPNESFTYPELNESSKDHTHSWDFLWVIDISRTQWVIQYDDKLNEVLSAKISRTQWVICISRTQWIIQYDDKLNEVLSALLHSTAACTSPQLNESCMYHDLIESSKYHELNESFTHHELSGSSNVTTNLLRSGAPYYTVLLPAHLINSTSHLDLTISLSHQNITNSMSHLDITDSVGHPIWSRTYWGLELSLPLVPCTSYQLNESFRSHELSGSSNMVTNLLGSWALFTTSALHISSTQWVV